MKHPCHASNAPLQCLPPPTVPHPPWEWGVPLAPCMPALHVIASEPSTVAAKVCTPPLWGITCVSELGLCTACSPLPPPSHSPTSTMGCHLHHGMPLAPCMLPWHVIHMTQEAAQHTGSTHECNTHEAAYMHHDTGSKQHIGSIQAASNTHKAAHMHHDT